MTTMEEIEAAVVADGLGKYVSEFYSEPIGRVGPPTCDRCGAPIGKCRHTGGPLDR